MTINISGSNPGYQDMINNFANQQRVEGSTKRLLEERGGKFKIFRNTSKYIFDLVSVTNIVPLDFIPGFKAAKACVTIIFEVGNIISKAKTLKTFKGNKLLCERKIEKWELREREITLIQSGNADFLKTFRVKYQNKLAKLDNADQDYKVLAEKSKHWTKVSELIDVVLNDKDSDLLHELVEVLSKKRVKKISSWIDMKGGVGTRINKSRLDIVTTVGNIALEVLKIAAVALVVFDGGISLSLVIIISGLGLSALKLGKYVWWGIKNGDSVGEILTKSLEKTMIAVAGTGVLPSSPLCESSVIRGFFNTCFAAKGIIYNRKQIQNYKRDLEVNKYYSKRFELMDKVAECNRFRERIVVSDEEAQKVMCELLDKYEDLKIPGARAEINRMKEKGLDPTNERDGQCLQEKIEKWNGYLAMIRKAIHSLGSKDVNQVIRKISHNKRLKVSNIKLSEKSIESKMLKSNLQIALRVTEIARFSLLSVAVTINFVGIGVNFVPALVVAGIGGNILYLAYLVTAKKINKELDGIHSAFKQDKIVDGSTESSAPDIPAAA